MGELERLAYFLAPFGRVRADLHQESAAVYRRLVEVGEVERYKRIPQLGIVSRTWEGARHTRWDYISLTLHLIGALARDTSYKLTTGVRMSDRETFSSRRELLQTWALIAHIGHLHWTFMAERLLLAELLSAKPAATAALDELLLSVPEGEARNWARDTVNQQRIYQFHQVLGFYRIDRLAGSSEQAASWKRTLADLVVEGSSDSPALSQSRDMFRRIRRIAFLALDSEYSPTILTLRTGRLLNDPYAFERLVTVEVGSRADELSSLQDYLSTRVYLGRRTLEETVRHRRSASTKISRQVAHKPFSEVVDLLARREFTEGIKSDKRYDWVTRLELDARLLDIASRRSGAAPVIDLEAAENSWFRGRHVAGEVAVAIDTQGELLVHQTHARSGNARSRAACLASGFRMLQDLPLDFTEELWQRILVAPAGRDLLLQALRQFFGEDLRWRFSKGPGLDAVVVPPGGIVQISQELSDYQQMPWSRRAEIVATCDLASRVTASHVLASLQSIVATTPEGKDKAEIDGAILYVDSIRHQVVLLLVEVKVTTRSPEARARRDLESLTAKLGNPLRAWRSRAYSSLKDGVGSSRRIYRAGY